MHYLNRTCSSKKFQDVGKSILESYSRVLESLSFNVIARIDDLLYVDDLIKHSDKISVPTVSVIAHKNVSIPYSVPVSGTPYKTYFSPAPRISPARGERTPFLHSITTSNNSHKPNRRGFGVKKVLTNYLGVDTKPKICGSSTETTCPNPNGTEGGGHESGITTACLNHSKQLS